MTAFLRVRHLGTLWNTVAAPPGPTIQAQAEATWRAYHASVPALAALSEAGLDLRWMGDRFGLAVFHPDVADEPVFRAEPWPAD